VPEHVVERPQTAADPDAPLVRGTLAGDLAAFEQLVQRHQAVVHRIATRVVGRDEADDVVQETFLRAYHRLERFRGESAFRSWLLQIASNSALNAARRKTPVPVEEVPETDSDLAAGSPGGPVTQLEERERRERLELKLGGLRREHRVVLVLRDLEGLSYEEIATVTESPVGSVKGRLHRARNELIALMRANTYDWGLPDER
jgi:RNA polymerase sigma-70 factor (ECF subfamily)